MRAVSCVTTYRILYLIKARNYLVLYFRISWVQNESSLSSLVVISVYYSKLFIAKNIYTVFTIKCLNQCSWFIFPSSSNFPDFLYSLSSSSSWCESLFRTRRFTSGSLSSTGTCLTLCHYSMIPDRSMWCNYSFDEVDLQLSRCDSW